MVEPFTRKKILIVEDEAIVARDIAQQVDALNYEVVGIANSAARAMEISAASRPDLVLMDIQLAGPVDGIAAAVSLREKFDIPVVFLTAFAADEKLERAKLAEPFGYIIKPFTERELSATLAMALYKHDADTRLRNTMRDLKILSGKVLQVQESERRRVAMELHDELGQSLTAIKINLQISQRLKDQAMADITLENIRIVEDALQQVRRIASNLRPSMLDDLGLAAALQWIGEQSAIRSGFSVKFHCVRGQSRLAAEIETACFRIVQEALTNIKRHAHASSVDISLDREQDTLLLRITDNGCGFNLEEMRSQAVAGNSIGVLGMQERATLVQGELTIESAPGKGSTVQLRAPWRDHEEAT